MFWSAVSSTLFLMVMGPQSAPLTIKERAAWERIKPSIAFLIHAGRPTGAAALIDRTGLFIAHTGAVVGQEMDARLHDGRTIRLRLKNTDGTTQLSLLKAVGQMPGYVLPLRAPQGRESSGDHMFAILPTGPVRADLVSSNQMGRVGPQLRILPLSEIRFEKADNTIGGALLVTYNREFLGSLNATLAKPGADQVQGNALMQGKGGGLGGLQAPPNVRSMLGGTMGPAEMTVAYTVGPDVVRHVVEEFLSTDGEVEYPTLGVFCRDAPGDGALVQKVVPDSGAEKAGLRLNDIILEINGTRIRDQIDFSRVMFRQKVGATIPIRIRRDNRQMVLQAKVGGQAD